MSVIPGGVVVRGKPGTAGFVQQRGIAGNTDTTFTAPAPPSPFPGANGWFNVQGGNILAPAPGPSVWNLLFNMAPDVDPTGTGAFLPGQSLTLQDANNNVVLSLTRFIPNGGVFIPLVVGASYTIVPAGFPAGATYSYYAGGPLVEVPGPTLLGPTSPTLFGRFSSPQLAAAALGPAPGLPPDNGQGLGE
jgi:hypothetical protein